MSCRKVTFTMFRVRANLKLQPPATAPISVLEEGEDEVPPSHLTKNRLTERTLEDEALEERVKASESDESSAVTDEGASPLPRGEEPVWELLGGPKTRVFESSASLPSKRNAPHTRRVSEARNSAGYGGGETASPCLVASFVPLL
uniref:Uncharacterized protein n=2 Tax=Steinernema glaseri TaxID=37863 RepID=A0A1I7ZRX4_9BILA